MPGSIATLGGVPLGGSDFYEWEIRPGAIQVERLFPVTKSRAAQIPLLQPLELVLEGPRGALRCAEVYVLEVLPGSLPAGEREQQVNLRLADRRWKWGREWISTTLNLRRATGETRLVNAGQEENARLVPEIEYARFSLYPPESPAEPWTATTALRWLVETKLGTPLELADQLPEIEIESLQLEDDGQAALERLMAYLPGAALFIAPSGRAVVYDVASGKERELLARFQARPQSGSVQVVDRTPLAPSEYVIHFTPEAELRLGYREVSGAGSIAPRAEDTPTLYPVLQVPDFELELEDRTVARGTWAEQGAVFDAWGSFGIHNQPVSFDALRRHMFKYGFAQFETAWGNDPRQAFDPVRALRARVAAESFRTFFRLDRFFWQRIESIRAVRIAIIDPQTGTYAPAEAFSDWTRRPQFKGLAYANDPNVNHGWAVRGYADLLVDADAAPVEVRIADPQSGVIQLVPKLDPWGMASAMALGYPVDGILPKQGGIGMAEAIRTGNELYARWDMVELEGGWQLAIVLTVVPASPNDLGRLWTETVSGDDVGVPGRGPPLHLRVLPGVCTARFAWTDSQGQPLVDAILGRAPLPEAALFNGVIVRDVARATARRAAEVYLSRPIGEGAIDMTPDAVPTGTLSSVRHQLAGGHMRTVGTFRAATQPADIWRYLDSSTRRAILNVLNRPGAQAQGET